jgi:hypothetical protein
MNRSILPIIFLLVIPIGIIISHNFETPIDTNPESEQSYVFYISNLAFILVFAYGVYPKFYSSEKFFGGKAAKTTINEYQWVKRILYFEIPVLIILTVISALAIARLLTLSFSYMPLDEIAYPVIAGIIWLFLVKKRGYQYHIAHAYIIKSLEEKNSIEKTRNVIKSIKYYSSYLHSKLGESIGDIDKVQSKFSKLDIDKRNDTILKISQAFDSEDEEKVKQVLIDVFEIEITPTKQTDKLKNMFSEKGLVVYLIIPVTGLIVSIVGMLKH